MIKQENIKNKIYPIVFVLVILCIWEFVVKSGLIPEFMLPSPTRVFAALYNERWELLSHSKTTLIEAFVGLSFGVLLGFLVAIVMDMFLPVKRFLYPLIVVSQTIPTVAIAPLLVLWMGYDMLPKIVLIVLTTFFPIAVGVYDGFQSVDEDYIILLKSMNANKIQVFRYLKLPAAMGHFFAALKISVSYSIVGAVIAEWLGGFNGLGVYMTRVKKAFAFDKMFAVIIIISVISLILMKIVDIVRKNMMKWEYVDED